MSVISLAEAQSRSNNELDSAIYETLINEGEVLPMISFEPFNGTTYDFMRENTLPAAVWAGPDATLTSDQSDQTPVSVSLKQVYEQFDIPNFYRITLSNIVDHVQVELRQAVKSLIRDVNDAIFYGDYNDDNTNKPEGLHEFLRVNTGQVVENGSGSDGNAATIAELDQVLRLVKGGDPSVLLMTRVLRDSLKRYWDSLGSSYAMVEMFGRKMMGYNDIPILGTDYLSSSETITTASFSAKTGGTNNSTIFVVRFGPDAMHGITAEGMQSEMGWEVEPLGTLEDKDSIRYRIKWYLNPVVVKSTLAVAGYTGLKESSAWTA